jgi:DNA repair exonuclease SbcCD ATPase subunit
MRLVSLRFKGFRAFPQEQFIEFSPTGLTAIVGPSGAGKTSIFQAIAVALGYSSFANSKQQSWHNDEAMQIDLALTDGTDNVLIRRGKTTNVTVNGDVVAKGATDVNKWVPSYFGIGPAMLKVMTFQPQRSQGAFLSMKNDERRTFLTSVLGLQRYETGLQEIKKESNAKFNEVERLKTRVATLTESLPAVRAPGKLGMQIVTIDGIDPDVDHLNTDLPTLFAPFIEAIEADGRRLRGSYDTLRQDIQYLESQRELALNVLRVELATDLAPMIVSQPPPSDTIVMERIGKVRAKLKEIDDRIADLNSQARLMSSASDKTKQTHLAAELNKQIKFIASIEKSICPTCQQAWHTADVAAEKCKAAALSASIEEVAASIVVTDNALAANFNEIAKQRINRQQVESIEAQLNTELQQEGQRRQTEFRAAFAANEKLRDARRATHDLAAAECRQNFEGKIQSHRQILVSVETQLRETAVKLTAIKTQLAGSIDLQRSIRSEYAAYGESTLARAKQEKAIALAADELSGAKHQLSELMDLEAATKAFLSVINDEILAEVADATNDTLGTLPNATNIRIAFRTERLTDSGDLKSEIKSVISMGDHDDIDFESQLSGGQQTAVELSSDRAVARVMKRRHGGSRLPDWVCLDEPFNGLGDAKEACREILQRMAADCQILVIDHGSEMKASFDRTLTVTPGPQGSTIG